MESSGTNKLILHVRRRYFILIAEGKKAFEYRLVTPYWEKRLLGREYEYIEIHCGYPKKGDRSRIIRRQWNGFVVIEDFVHEEFGSDPVRVFAIDVAIPTAGPCRPDILPDRMSEPHVRQACPAPRKGISTQVTDILGTYATSDSNAKMSEAMSDQPDTTRAPETALKRPSKPLEGQFKPVSIDLKDSQNTRSKP
jgi:hypothetical protein